MLHHLTYGVIRYQNINSEKPLPASSRKNKLCCNVNDSSPDISRDGRRNAEAEGNTSAAQRNLSDITELG
jgi:hypothetical protein